MCHYSDPPLFFLTVILLYLLFHFLSEMMVRSPQQPNTASRHLCHSPHFTSSRTHFIVSRHHKKGKYSTVTYFERDHTHRTFGTIYCCHCPILLLVIFVDFLLHLIYKLIKLLQVYMCRKKYNMYGDQDCLQFQASPGGDAKELFGGKNPP